MSMVKISKLEFEEIMAEAIDAIPEKYLKRLQNVAFILEDEPTAAKLKELNLGAGQTLFGLYEGLPLPRRMGTTKLLPDKITLYKVPLQEASDSVEGLKEQLRHTLWHEVAHYFGLDHPRIHELERASQKNINKLAK